MLLANLGLNIQGFQVTSSVIKLMITASFSKVSFGLFKMSRERFMFESLSAAPLQRL